MSVTPENSNEGFDEVFFTDFELLQAAEALALDLVQDRPRHTFLKAVYHEPYSQARLILTYNGSYDTPNGSSEADTTVDLGYDNEEDDSAELTSLKLTFNSDNECLTNVESLSSEALEACVDAAEELLSTDHLNEDVKSIVGYLEAAALDALMVKAPNIQTVSEQLDVSAKIPFPELIRHVTTVDAEDTVCRCQEFEDTDEKGNKISIKLLELESTSGDRIYRSPEGYEPDDVRLSVRYYEVSTQRVYLYRYWQDNRRTLTIEEDGVIHWDSELNKTTEEGEMATLISKMQNFINTSTGIYSHDFSRTQPKPVAPPNMRLFDRTLAPNASYSVNALVHLAKYEALASYDPLVPAQEIIEMFRKYKIKDMDDFTTDHPEYETIMARVHQIYKDCPYIGLHIKVSSPWQGVLRDDAEPSTPMKTIKFPSTTMPIGSVVVGNYYYDNLMKRAGDTPCLLFSSPAVQHKVGEGDINCTVYTPLHIGTFTPNPLPELS